ncbi:DUF3943 domain-containing protein, partial [Vibrio sp. S4M6]|uniref:DUF3943 domain-containing protein n=1 Tax=Vibrio sinus TaxID=2946865 RepID=UPI00202A60AA|nr:DUF3943 domain-containing protein [Vibrio sinus]
MFKKSIAVALLSFSAVANAYDVSSIDQFDFNSKPYQVNYDQLENYPSSLPASTPYSLALAESANKDPKPLPKYLTVQSEPDWEYLKSQTYTTLGLSVVTVGLMTLLPSSITKWDEDSRDVSQLGTKWKDNVSSGPTWDRDEHYLNYIMHPYFGGVYYTAARHAGYNEFQSFLYSAFLSTFFWEYGVEAFAEVPSWQDLFVTPFFGAVAGEYMFEKEQEIVAEGGEVWGSKTMGDVTLFLLNPIGHIDAWASDLWNGHAEFEFTSSTWDGYDDARIYALNAGAHPDSVYYGGKIKFTF